MAQNNIVHHVHVILDAPNYTFWAQSMLSFLKGLKLWFYVNGDLERSTETNETFHSCLIDWDINHHQILTCFRNTTIPSISTPFGNYDEAKGAWDMLASRYSSIDGSREYQLMLDLYHLTQEPNKLLMISLLACNSYGTNLLFLILLGRIVHMLRCMLNEGINITFYQFMMALHDDFEPILGKLLHRIPLPTLDKAIFELVLGETRLQTMHS
jgi:hypothetical protein